MKTVKEFILEKLKIDKNIKVNDPKIRLILCKALGLDENDDEDILDIIQKFFDDNNYIDINIIAYKDLVDDLELPKSVIKYYTIDNKLYDDITNNNNFNNELFSDSNEFKILSSNNILSIGYKLQDPIYLECK